MDLLHKKQSINAVKWALVDKGGSQIIILINTLVLARLLHPRDFGLVSMLYIFMSLSSAFVDSGMAGGLIRKQDVTNTDCSTLFTFNVFVAIILYLLFFTLAPYIAVFYNEPQITSLLRVLGINIIISSFAQIHKALLFKSLKVRFVTRADLIGSFIAVCVSIFCAYKGLGVWSLIILQLTQSFISMILLWKYSKWVPDGSFSMTALKEFYAFGMGLFLSVFIDIIFKNIYQPLIGKFFAISYAGYYYQSKRLYELPILTISSVVDSISYPILVKYQNDIPQLKKSYKQIFNLLIFISLPMVTLFALLSDQIVITLLGKKWLFSAELLRILSFSGIFLILETINRSLLKIEARTTLIFKLEVVKKILIVITILCTYKFGIIFLMYGIVLNSILSFALNQYFTTIKISGYKNIFMILLSSIGMGVCVQAIISIGLSNLISLFLAGGVGIGVYFLLGYILKINEQRMVFSIIGNKLK